MARYIDVDALWKDVTSNIDYCADFLEIIERQSTVNIKDLTGEIKVTNCNYNQFAEVSKKDDTISRKAVYDALECMRFASDAERRYGFSLLEQIPTAQSEIIRCKECKHWDTSWQNDYAPNYHYCPLVDGTRRDDFYCADAERRTDEMD